MRILSIDIETYSDVDLSKSGVYPYAESDNFEILFFGYSVDGHPPQVIDLANGEQLPDDIIAALTDPNVIKTAYNAMFERICISKHLGLPKGTYLDPTQWHCTMVWAATLGLPMSLAGVGAVLGLDKQKMSEGKDLIKFFCIPDKDGNRHHPKVHPGKWELFKSYNCRDVEVEIAIQQRLAKYPVPNFVWNEYHLDQQINDRGIGVDMELVRHAITINEDIKNEITAEIQALTMLDNPNSVQQMKEWLAENGMETESLGKQAVKELLETAPPELAKVLSLRQQLAKSSVKKYDAMLSSHCIDDRIRGMFQFYGANRSGRFSGRLVQLQNLYRNSMPHLDTARDLIKADDIETLDLLFGDIPDVLSQLIRTALVPKAPYKRFIVADFTSIEGVVLSWLAGEQWRLDVFKNGGDIYCISASKIFGVPVVKHGINGHLRQKGKIAELACGYGGSVGAMKAMGAQEMGLSDDEIQQIVTDWRDASPNIVKLWWDVDRAVKKCIKEKTEANVKGLHIFCESGFLFIELPSGRRLAYVKPKIGENKFGGESVTYMGVGEQKKWERIESYGPKFVENIIQGIARDILLHAMMNLRDYRIVAHVHDEVIIEATDDITVDEIVQKMCITPRWARGLTLRADGYECEFYMKD
ncbi:DNA polymerase [Ruminococcus callidus]|jgi:DNA polymerase|nr:DNA polymerase [Ruminococcus callidus]MCB5775915.1 DNA polymerase [Ruminococcus callidus]MCC2759614.1 DNA polymerase [Ruminococcus callidus]